MDPQLKRQAREIALQILFQSEFTPPLPLHDFVGLYEGSFSTEVLDYASELVEGVREKQAQLDPLIQSVSKTWKLERMSVVDRNILRMAVYEIRMAQNPLKPSIVINEAVEIAKKFGTTESGAFVNGLLDQIRKDSGWD